MNCTSFPYITPPPRSGSAKKKTLKKMASAGPRYAPPDPTLPEPWRALVDGNTGYIYYWNPHSNVTQYERPDLVVPPPVPPPMPPPPSATPQFTHFPTHNNNNNNTATPLAVAAHAQHNNNQVLHPSSGYGVANCGSSIVNNSNNGQSHRSQEHNYPRQGNGCPNMQYNVSYANDIEAYKKEHELTAVGNNVPAPFMTFDSAGLPSEMLRELQNAGFSSPTPIQAQTWPIALQNRDIVAIAKTGSGKTLGYLLPAFLHLKNLRNNSVRGPTALVLSPTRELATQIQAEAVKFGRSSRIITTCVYGGAPKGPQLRDLERGADIVVATPGRLNDFLQERKVNLGQVSFLVLDEADRMLDMGFEPQIRRIVNEIPVKRQTLMYTATWPKEVRKIASDLLVNAVQVNIGNVDELSANKSITQYVEVVPSLEKQRRLEQILHEQERGAKILVFCTTKKMCDQLARRLSRQFGAAAIHGDKSQVERDWVLSQFKTGRSPILVATDVAARGLDIKDIRVVINFDFPTGIEDYVHRIGRTGRAGATGIAYTFITDQDSKYCQDLIKLLEGADQKVPQQLRDTAVQFGSFRGRSGKWDSRAHGGRDGARGGRGFLAGRDEPLGGRGGDWRMTAGRVDSKDRGYERYGGPARYDHDDKNGNFHAKHDRDGHDRYDREANQRYGGTELSRDRSKKHYSSRSRSRSRSPRSSYSRSHGRSYSRSRSPRYDRYVAKPLVYKRNSPFDDRNAPLNAPSEHNGLPGRNAPPSRTISPHIGSTTAKPVSNYDNFPRTDERPPYQNGVSHTSHHYDSL